MITIIASESTIASLINEQFAEMLSEWQWEHDNPEEAEALKALKWWEGQMREHYESDNKYWFERAWEEYSDIHKEIYGVRPRWFFDTCRWYHGTLV